MNNDMMYSNKVNVISNGDDVVLTFVTVAPVTDAEYNIVGEEDVARQRIVMTKASFMRLIEAAPNVLQQVPNNAEKE